jgi:hypothetical protein
MTEDRFGKYKAKKFAKAIMKSNTLKDAYKNTHPASSESSARANAHRLLKHPNVIEELDKLLDPQKDFEANKEKLMKILGAVIMNWQEGNEMTRDMLRALELAGKMAGLMKDSDTNINNTVISTADIEAAKKNAESRGLFKKE